MSQIKYYPVGNGDQSLITLEDETTILVDCNIRESAEQDDSKMNIKEDLLESLKKRDNNPFVDVFILTHGDEDHCRGFETNFYQGDPKNYSEKNRRAGEIIVDEMWFSPMIAEEHKNPNEEVYQKEAERRIELHQKKNADKDLPGNRIRIFGYDTKKNYSGIDHLRTIPGNLINIFNQKSQSRFSVFIHAPFQEHLQSADKNQSSIVFQARFKEYATDLSYLCRAIFGGDSDHNTWKVIIEKSKKYKNEEALKWDLFLGPHHCSWSYFNDRPYKDKGIDNSTPVATSLEFLDYKEEGAKVITSCKKILDDDDNPPHYPARNEYIKKVDKNNFINTDQFYDDYNVPVVFIIDKNGITLKKNDVKVSVSAGFSSPPRSGRS